MRYSAPGRQTGLLAGTIATFLAVVVVWTPSARAGCGPHWLTSRFEAHRELMRIQLLALDASSTSPDQEPSRAPVPCSGAFCSGNPAAPISTAPSLARTDSEHWAFSSGPAARDELASLLSPDTAPTLHPVDRADAIFHPPPHVMDLDA